MNQSNLTAQLLDWLKHPHVNRNLSIELDVLSRNDTLRLIFAYFELYHPIFILYLVIGGAICLIGTLFNILCLAAIFTYPPLRHRGSILVANFVLVNLLLSATVYPISLVALSCHYYCYLPDNNCNWAYYFYFILQSLTWQECFLALNRFVAIVLPHEYHYVSSTKATFAFIFLGYFIPLILNLSPAGSSVPTYTETAPFGGCLYNQNGNPIFRDTHAIVGVYLPMTVVGLSYCAIFVRVGISRYDAGGAKLSSSMQRRLTLAKMLFASFIWYCLTYLPQPILTAAFPSIYFIYPATYFYARWALFMGAGANAIIYATTNKDYRHGMLFVLNRSSTRKTNPQVASLPWPIANEETGLKGSTSVANETAYGNTVM
ncbi:hypothetical protein BV898_00263 [Hypsibius exemplaris]|uniref:G-protein coupled receptors family 1 profile domain-containing protein n=1 Tax=Hypsibius exemplaris TaxID=2072580 RepID=A0A1W0XFK7_HYPEX|nr:hypothetical protein BV898_00263 [Hypsibius exemplaris]